MTYEQVASITQVAALLFFVALFAGVLIYAFWPGNKKRFEEAAKIPAGEGPRPRARERRLSAMASNKRDTAKDAETTGHEWDGITRAEQAAAQMVAVDVLRLHRLGDRLLAAHAGMAAGRELYQGPARLQPARDGGRAAR